MAGTADELVVTRPAPDHGPSHVGGPHDEVASDAFQALVTLGWKPGIARSAVGEAHAELGTAPLDALLRAALRHCASR